MLNKFGGGNRVSVWQHVASLGPALGCPLLKNQDDAGSTGSADIQCWIRARVRCLGPGITQGAGVRILVLLFDRLRPVVCCTWPSAIEEQNDRPAAGTPASHTVASIGTSHDSVAGCPGWVSQR